MFEKLQFHSGKLEYSKPDVSIFFTFFCVYDQFMNTIVNFSLENVSFTSTEDDKQDYQEELLLDFADEERSSIFKVRFIF